MGCKPSKKNADGQVEDHPHHFLWHHAKKKLPEKVTIFVLGGPGSGKGTQCREVVSNFGFSHISVGDLLRAEVERGSSSGKKIEKAIKEGQLVPLETTMSLLMEAMDSSKDKHFLIDGFPRSVEQAEAFEEKSGRPNLVICLECPFEVLQKRLIKHGETSGRIDDNVLAIKKRFETFQKESVPVVSHYENKEKDLVKKVNSSATPVEVFVHIASILKERFGIEPVTAHATFDHKKHDCRSRTIVFVLGGPGVGKGTQCAFMVRDFGYTHVSTGDLLRNEVKLGTDLGKECDALMKEGKLIPLASMMKLVTKALDSAKCKHFLVDGFPRSLEQVHDFELQVGKPNLVLSLDCSMEEMERRLVERGKTSGRADDNVETIRKRFQLYLDESKPVIEYYKTNAPNIVKNISTAKRPDEVYKDIKAVLHGNIEKVVH